MTNRAELTTAFEAWQEAERDYRVEFDKHVVGWCGNVLSKNLCDHSVTTSKRVTFRNDYRPRNCWALAPPTGLEPVTFRLTVERSAN
jgi:hypothetical protein